MIFFNQISTASILHADENGCRNIIFLGEMVMLIFKGAYKLKCRFYDFSNHRYNNLTDEQV